MVKPTSGVAKEKEELFTLKIQVKEELIEAIVDTKSEKNMISSSLVERLGLETTPQPRPYSLGWIKKDVDTQVNRQHLKAGYLTNSIAIIRTARHSVSSSSSHHQGTSSHQHNDDDDDDDNVQTSRASTPSPTTYLNSLDPLNYQNYQMPSASEQTDETLFERQTVLLNQTQQMHKEMRGGFKSFGKALKGVFSKKKK
ncbi:hypothetical protein Tco_0393309 [Tanacetum coccineum]